MSEGADPDLAAIRDAGGDHLDLPFWQGCRRGEFLVHRCGVCERSYWPASRCIDHGDADMRWVPASGEGEVHTFTIFHHAYGARLAGKVPYCLAVVKLDEGPFFHTNVVDCPLEEIAVGMRVRARMQVDPTSGLTLPMFAPAR